ncbi:hypothetical protein JOC55_004737 [Paenibacillus sacheonensis]|nr:hypothetical protein [Paenibacillus sacheonensis]
MRNRIRLLMVMDSLAVGGTETYVLSLVTAFPQLGILPVYAGGSGGCTRPSLARDARSIAWI